MKHGNPPEYWQKVISRTSKAALETFNACGCGCKNRYPCLPVDHNRIIFVSCKKKYKNKIQWPYSTNPTITFGDSQIGIAMRCPLDCAVRGSAYDDGERYNRIKEQTKHIKLYRPVIVCKIVSLYKYILNWFKNWLINW